MPARDVSRSLTIEQVRWLDRLSELCDLYGIDRGLRPIAEIVPAVLARVEPQVIAPAPQPRPASRSRKRDLRQLEFADFDFTKT